jgi:Ca2+-binding RTX toxin-like protein
MAVHVIDPSHPLPPTYGDNENALDLGVGEIVILRAGAEIAAYGEGSLAISGYWDNTLLIDGRVHSELLSAISIQGVINVGMTGSVSGAVDGVYLYGENEPGRPNTVFNAGSITGGVWGVRLEAAENIVSNSGKIVGEVGIEASSSDQYLVINNTGLIKGTGGVAIYGAWNGANTVTNSGRIEGDIFLGSRGYLMPDGPPTNIYDGRGGTITGLVHFFAGNDIAYGGDGSETFYMGTNINFVDGGAGIDTLQYDFKATVDLRVTTQQQTFTYAWDTIQNIENLSGSAFSDSFIGNEVSNILVGAGENDALDGQGGNDMLTGGTGNDTITGGDGTDIAVFSGRSSDYTITTGRNGLIISDNRTTGGDGIDQLTDVEFAIFSDHLYTLPTNTPTTPGSTEPQVHPTPDAPVMPEPRVPAAAAVPIEAAATPLNLKGSKKADILVGGAGNDQLNGGLGRDKLTGGDGADVFVFSTKLKSNLDRITDFDAATDTIRLSKAVFGQLQKGSLAAEAFRVGKKALDADDRVLFNAKTGTLSYDADGSGDAHAAITFAQLKAKAALTSADFLVL